MELNKNQLEAVTCPLGPTLVIAGPGSGKTQVIVNRVHYMIKKLQCEPRRILVVTFSKLAAQEMQSRFIECYGNSLVNFGTLHSIFYKILRRSNPERYHLDYLLLEDKRKILLTSLLKEMECDEGEEFIELFIKHISLMKNKLIVPKEYEPIGIERGLFLSLLTRYEAYKERHKLFDFDDMLVECYYLLKNDNALLQIVSNNFKYLLVDEFQDINLVQFEILRMIASHHQNIFAVGDDDQSIYQFRGANPIYLLKFKTFFEDVNQIYLTVNYRCSRQILKYSLALIEQNKLRYPKQLVTPNQPGEKPCFITCKDTREEALHIVHEIAKRKEIGVSLNDMAIIYRTNIQARPIVEALLIANIPFCVRDGMVSLYEQWITKDILAYLYLAQNYERNDFTTRIINKPKRYISKVNLEKAKSQGASIVKELLKLDTLTSWQKNTIQEFMFQLQVVREKPLKDAITYIINHIGYASYLHEYATYRKMPVQSLLDILDDIIESAANYSSIEEWEEALIKLSKEVRNNNFSKDKNKITLTTMHGAKGLEFNTVFIIDVVQGTIPYHKSNSTEEIEEERRLLYVGMTRAKEKLNLYIPQNKHNKVVEPSIFISEIKSELAKNRLKVGSKLYHKNLGEGVIQKIIDSHILNVKFNNGQIRKIDSNYCINNDIITWEDEKNE